MSRWTPPHTLTHLPISPAEWAAEILNGQSAENNMDPAGVMGRMARLDADAAERIRDRVGRYLSYSPALRCWYVWDGRVHRPAEDETAVRGVVRAYSLALGIVADELARYAEYTLEGQAARDMLWHITRYREYAERISGAGGIRGLVEVMESVLYVPADTYLDDARWLVVQNGVYDLDAVRRDRRWDLLPHDPARPVYRFLDLEDDGADCRDVSTWNDALRSFLSTSAEDDAQGQFLMRAVAAALIGAQGKTRRVVVLQGAPSSGKSMFLGVLEHLCAGTDYYASPGIEAIEHVSRSPQHARWPMRNARISAFSEARRKLDQMFLLSYSGGDPYTVEAKYRNALTVHPQGIVFVANNYPVNVEKTDSAMIDRLAIVYFPHSFTDTATDPALRRDPALGDRIKADRPGTFQMLKAAYLDYLEHGLDRTERMEARLRGEAEESNPVTDWLSVTERYKPAPDGMANRDCALAVNVFTTFKAWEDTQRLPAGERLRKSEFYRLLEDQGYVRRKTPEVRVIGLRDDKPSQVV